MATELSSSVASLPILSVSQFTDVLKEILEAAFPVVWISGEISNFSRHSPSGHCYLTLKDEHSQIRAVIWKGTAQRIRSELHDGLEVIVRGHLDLYAPRGEYKLIVDELQLKGLGALELKFRQLHEKLTAEGLFAADRKRPLPAISAADCLCHQSHRRGNPRFSGSASPPLARRACAGCAGPSAGNWRRRGNRGGDCRGESISNTRRHSGGRPRWRQLGRSLVVQRRSGRPCNSRFAHSSGLGGGP